MYNKVGDRPDSVKFFVTEIKSRNFFTFAEAVSLNSDKLHECGLVVWLSLMSGF